MSLGDWFRRVFGSKPAVEGGRPAMKGGSGRSLPDAERERLEAMLAALEAGPPGDMHDGRAWDEYWKNQVKVGVADMEVSLMDGMASDATLPALLSRREARTVLCAGNGLSTEAISLALHGFDVTALDISSVPAQLLAAQMRRPESRLNRIPGMAVRDDGSVTISVSGLIEPEMCPPMHQSADCPNKGGGALSFVTGDLTDPELCPGPFDVVIERRTLQLFQGTAQAEALDRLIARLRAPGVFVSHQHAGGWRPGDERTHYAESWLQSRGFVVRSGKESREHDSTPRLACLMFSTG